MGRKWWLSGCCSKVRVVNTEAPAEWPPKVIVDWLAMKTVNAKKLARTMREWADFIYPEDAS